MADDDIIETTTAGAETAPIAAGRGAGSPVDSGHPPRRGRTATVISLRVVRGLVGVAAAVLVVAAVGLVPLPTVGIDALATTVEPEPADLLAVCPGGLLRLGDDRGGDAGRVSAIGPPEVTLAALGGQPDRTALENSDAGTGGTDSAPSVVRLAPTEGAALAAAQQQLAASEAGMRGLAAAPCTAPTSSSWLVGGATTVGRTTLLLLANPTAVTAEVTVELWGESGPVVAPGTSGIQVAPGTQRVVPMSGLAPGLASPVVHVEARGGQVVAALQTSVIRVLDPGGVDLVGPGTAPAREVVVPAVRIADEIGVSSSLGLDDAADLEAIARIGNPGDADADVVVSITPSVAGGVASTFELGVPAGDVVDIPLSSAFDLGEDPLPDGSYTVSIAASIPVVAGVRASTTPAPTTDADGDIVPGPADLAWFASGAELRGDTALAVADGPAPVLVVVNAANAERTLVIESIDGATTHELVLPAAGSASLGLDSATGYVLRDASGLRAAVTFAATGMVAGYPVRSPREADSPIVVRP